MSSKVWSNYVYDDPTSITGLRWKHDVMGGRKLAAVRRSAGAVAGCVDSSKGYARIVVDGSAYYAHRVVWELHNGGIPDNLRIDHIDGNPLNNAIGNIRMVTIAVNSRNRHRSKKNISGNTGVMKRSRKYKERVYHNWCAAYQSIDGVKLQKSFSVSKYGDEAFTMAVGWRADGILKMNQIGAGYSERHGHDD